MLCCLKLSELSLSLRLLGSLLLLLLSRLSLLLLLLLLLRRRNERALLLLLTLLLLLLCLLLCQHLYSLQSASSTLRLQSHASLLLHCAQSLHLHAQVLLSLRLAC